MRYSVYGGAILPRGGDVVGGLSGVNTSASITRTNRSAPQVTRRQAFSSCWRENAFPVARLRCSDRQSRNGPAPDLLPDIPRTSNLMSQGAPGALSDRTGECEV